MPECPVAASFSYVLIPADDSLPAELRHFGGEDDAVFRESITQYFRSAQLTDGQKLELAKHLRCKTEESRQRNAKSEGGPAPEVGQQLAIADGVSEREELLIQEYVSTTSFEIIPVVMPTRESKFVGTSIYIDNTGRFKELPLNSRASKMAQQDIRGDAFLLSNHDDPALDEWGRVDCPLERYEQLLSNPPVVPAYKTGSVVGDPTAQMREKDSKRIEPEMVIRAQERKDEGNQLFGKGDLAGAVAAYTEAIDLTEGRRDLLPNEAEVTSLRTTVLLNRCLCHLRLSKSRDAEVDARLALALEPHNAKALYRLATAMLQQNDFEAASAYATQCDAVGGPTPETQKLRQDIEAGKKRQLIADKQKFAKLFS